MPLKLHRCKKIWYYSGTIAGHRLRGSTKTTSREIAARIASEIESREFKRHLDGPEEVLTFPQAVALYLKADHKDKYLSKIEDYWKNARVKDMTAGAIRQSAIDLYPRCSGATWNRQVITPTQAVINHCAGLELCAPVRIKRFDYEEAIKAPVTLEWIQTLCAHARPVIKALVLVMFATGCRFCEAHRLEWDDIDFKARTIKIRDTKTKKQRIAHMPPKVMVALAQLNRSENPFYRSESTLRRYMDEDIAKTSNIISEFERLTFHSCRHGFATSMLHKGVDPKTAASLGGWDDVGLFMRVYAHAMQDATLTNKLFDDELAIKKVGDD